MKLGICVVFCVKMFFGFGNAELTAEDYAILPRIFDIENEECPESQFYCKFDVTLTPMDAKNPSKLWNIIEQFNNNNNLLYRRDLIYRGLCVTNTTSQRDFNEYSNHGLDGQIDESYCFESRGSLDLVNKYDIIFVFAILCYLAFLIYCTITTNKSNKNSELKDKYELKVNKYIEIFSITNIWNKIRAPNKSEDFNRLLCIQGLRTIAMAGVVATHNFVFAFGFFIENPEFIENFFSNPYLRSILGFPGLIVQPFFIFSSWLLALQLKNIVQRNEKITLKDLFCLILNRYFRLIPLVIVVLIIHSSEAVGYALIRPYYFSLAQSEITRCRSSWWKNLLFIQNIGNFGCSAISWYLAVDFQLYILILLLFYFRQNLKIPMKLSMSICLACTILIQIYTVLTTEYNGLVHMTPRSLPLEKILVRPEFFVSYLSPFGHLATYIIGFMFGTIYSENKNKNFFDSKIKGLLWYVSFLGLPILASVVYFLKHSRAIEALAAISLRPIFGFGVAIGVLGMSSNIGGISKKITEWQPLVFLGNFTFSVYMFHLPILALRRAAKPGLVTLTPWLLITDMIVDICLSFILGTFMCVILEHPCGQLQKMLLPQVEMKKNVKKSS